MTPRALWLAGALVLLATPAVAADYRPVACKAARPYAGKPLHSPPTAADLIIQGDIAGVFSPAVAARLQAAFDRALATPGAHAMTAAVAIPGQGVWTARGGADTPLFYWASAGKQATAAVVLQLVEEGRIRLSDPVSRWVPGVPNGDAITIETLLAHTSGLFSANEDLVVHRRGARLDLPAELAVLRRHGAMFCPGEAWRYSNSGYSLLGAVVEVVDGRPLDQAIRARIITPLGLRETRVLTDGASAVGVAPLRPDDGQPPIDMTVPGAAGPIAASALDMIRFQRALLGDGLLRPETRALMLDRLYPMFDDTTWYGLGVMLYDAPDTPRRLYWIGHGGGAPGVKAITAYAPDQHAFVAVAITGDGQAAAAANLLLKALADGR